MLPDLVKTYNDSNHNIRTITNLRTIADLLQTVSNSKVFFREVYKLTRIFFTFPITTATAERTFSTLRLLKPFPRSTLTQPNLNHSILLHAHKERTDCIVLTEIAKEFVAINERR